MGWLTRLWRRKVYNGERGLMLSRGGNEGAMCISSRDAA